LFKLFLVLSDKVSMSFKPFCPTMLFYYKICVFTNAWSV